MFNDCALCFAQTSVLNKHLQELMDGLTAKVFRTYNASITLQQQLKELTSGTSTPAVKGICRHIFARLQLGYLFFFACSVK